MATNSEAMSLLKHLFHNITISSTNARKQMLTELQPHIKSQDFPEAGVKLLCRILPNTLNCYRDAGSRRAVEQVLSLLLIHHRAAALGPLVEVLSTFGKHERAINHSRGSGGAALVGLHWTYTVVNNGFKEAEQRKGKIWEALVQTQCDLSSAVLACGRPSIVMSAYHRLRKIWKEIPGSVTSYGTTLSSLEHSQYKICLIAFLMQYCSQNQCVDAISDYKASFVEAYVKGVFGGKIKPMVHVLVNSKWLLCHLTHNEFKESILPAVQKAMLRSPENVMEAYSYLLAGLSLDLSQYAKDLGKNIATQLHIKDDTSREEAAAASLNLAHQCSDADAVEEVAKLFFSVLNGSEGKLTVVTHRLAVLTGIGNLSYNTVSGNTSVQQLTNSVVLQFIPFLQQEVHEGTLIQALAVMSLWCAKFSTEVPKKLVEWFKKGMGLKQSTSVVRNAYIQCMLAAFRGDTLAQGLELLPILKQSLEKAKSQANQVAVVTEGLAAACMMVRLAAVDTDAESKFSFLWGTILNAEKQLFTSDKFLAAASEDGLENLLGLAEKLLIDHPDKFKTGAERPFHRALVTMLVHSSWKLRRSTHQTIKKLLTGPGSQQMTQVLLEEFRLVISAQKEVHLQEQENTPEVDGSGDATSCVTPKVLALALQGILLSVGVGLTDDDAKTKLVLDAILDAHHPLIIEAKPRLWCDIVCKFQLDLKKLVSANLDQILAVITANEPASKARLLAAKMLALETPLIAMEPLIDHLMSSLGNPALQTVTMEEYAIMQAPDGELYDKSVIGSIQEPTIDIGSMKRESKAYSYKDQLMEIELRKEIEAKKKAKGIKTEVKLTKKQQEAKDAQLAKESAIRSRLKKLDMELANALSLIQACVDGNSSEMRKHIPDILPSMLSLMSSPLGAPYTCKMILALRGCVFYAEEEILGSCIAYCILRLYKPACPIDANWCELDLVTAVTKAVNHIYCGVDEQWEDVDSDKSESDEDQPITSARIVSAPAFAYIFPMLRKVLRDGGAVVDKEEEVVEQALNIVCEHAKLRSEEEVEGEIIDESGPELLPRRGMLELLIHLISISGPIHQLVATTALVDVCASAGGGEGCTCAQQEEIDELLGAMMSSCAEVRSAALKGLHELLDVLPYPDTDRENGLNLLRRLWIAQQDSEEHIKTLATEIWSDGSFSTDPELCNLILQDTIHHESVIRESASEALATMLDEYSQQVDEVLKKLFDMYQDKLVIAPPVLDQLGRMISESPPDEYLSRCGIALALGKISPHLKPSNVSQLFQFFVPTGLGDRHEEVRKAMLEAARMCIDTHGKANVTKLLPVFENFLDEAPDSSSYDAVRQSVVILIGSLAKHLDKSDPKVKPIVGKLIEALSTPSQQVQEAVANCLPPLVPAIKSDAPTIVKRLLALLLESENYGERKGAAYGLAGLVKGLGILSLKQLDIMTTLQDAIQDKKNFRHREGALFAFEMLCSMLGRLFEPYVVHVLPHLLLCFGDNNQYVREATDDTAKAVMSKLSGHGVKLVLPSLLAALEEDSWRTKAGSVELLGAMAFCAPKQLSSCLPSIVPKLMEVLTDSHVKVQKAGVQALKQIGSVIRNPEIQAIVDILLDALSNPFQKTSKCLEVLLNTKFVHFIDAPSLALIMPVVQRAFQDRSTETKKMSAQIIGNMYSLTDQKDLAPYLPSVMPGLKASLLDPVPDVRKVSARALGAMVKGMGESSFDDLLPWLMEKLTSEQNSVDRSGAAQGLSEVVAGMGMQKLDKLMPDIVKTAEAPDIPPHVRDGYVMMFIYLPGTFGDKFSPYVGNVIPAILKALADESEFVRDTALRAGQRVVNMYADTAISIFLPELEKGLFDENWRIRYSSIQLLGDLLYRISGVSGKMTTVGHEDDNFGTEHSTKALIKILGPERRNRVLAGLYMGRSDTALMVRQAALHVWKVVVVNTPRTLKEILSTLFGLLLGCLASTSYDKRQVAARTLGDLVRKLGDRVLPEIIPILEKGLKSDQSDQRQGVCVGLSEIMGSTSREQVLAYIDSVVPTVRKALCDPLPEVREAAATTFDNLHGTIGHRALEDILPQLLDQLNDPDSGESALDGLKQVMAVKSRVVLPFLVPKLTSPPVNSKVLAILSEVAGDALTKHLGKILQALMSSLKDSICTEREAQELEYCQTVVLSVTDEQGLYTIMDELLPATRNNHPGMRRAAVTFLFVYCSQTKTDYSQFVPQLLRSLIALFADDDETVVNVAWDALNAVTKKLTAAEQLTHISSLRQAIHYATDSLQTEELPGFCLPKKGISPILPIFREGILNGAPEMKEQAAVGLGEVIKLTSTAALKSQVVNITGPLIRVLGDRYAWNVKVAILQTLGLLLAKVGVLLKAFLPQLQTTFLRALSDPNRNVRLEAALALAKLVVIHSRVDPLFTELHNGVKNVDTDISVRETMLQALRGVISGAGQKMGEAVRKTLTATLLSLLGMPEDTARMAVAGCLGALCAFMPDEDITELLIDHLLVSDPSQSWTLQHGRSVALAVCIKEAPSKLMDQGSQPDLLDPLVKTFTNDRVPICVTAIRGLGFYAKHCVSTDKPIPQQVVSALVKSLNHNSNEVKMTAAQMIGYIATARDDLLDMAVIKSLVVVLVSNTKDKNTAVQADSELALVSLLKLRQGQERYQTVSQSMDSIPAGNLADCMKRLNKVAGQPQPNIVIDDTILR